uniref:Fibrinogen C-terminal domain-containing protein n=2 Tax=Pyxicephalus adspersus TaxID=30357 RepID=A0AAV3A5D6_PYXAD|nr:TPA: hypothetical protein GDO54_015397 [Pyxicephalus adspersus]
MFPDWMFCSFFLLTFAGITCNAFLTHVSRQDLYNQIANKHLFSNGILDQLINVPWDGVFRELVAKDCRAAYLNSRRISGLYLIWPKNSSPLVVYCDLSAEGAGWTVLQRKIPEGNVSFGSSNWDDYRTGFGDFLGSHWLGNELIYQLTKQNAFSVRFLLTDSKGNKHYADYSSFRVDREANGYALRLGNYSGNAGDALTVWKESGIHDNMKFSTSDKDNDHWERNCAKEWKGGWWFDHCNTAILNTDGAIYWGDLCNEKNPCTATEIKIKPGSINCSPISLPGAGEYYPIHYS